MQQSLALHGVVTLDNANGIIAQVTRNGRIQQSADRARTVSIAVVAMGGAYCVLRSVVIINRLVPPLRAVRLCYA
jgi:hypothetical protein